jgi:ABC-type branched-subunit amino acid transport system ATPase component
LLSVNNVDVAYGRARVLHNVPVELSEGEIVFIAGRNGAGKTTLLKTIAGFLRPASGSIVFEGKDITGLGPEKVALSGIRYVFQDKRVFSRLTVRENLEIAAYPLKEDVSAAVEMVKGIYPAIERLLDSPAGGLSGGQRQILLIGRALIGSPKLLLVDEPTEGLAATTINDILKVLSMMKGKVSMLVVEQNLSVVGLLADRVYIMQEGKVVKEFADKEELKEKKNLEKYL